MEGQTDRSVEQTENPERDPHKYAQLIFDRGTKTEGQPFISIGKKQARKQTPPQPNTIYKN